MNLVTVDLSAVKFVELVAVCLPAVDQLAVDLVDFFPIGPVRLPAVDPVGQPDMYLFDPVGISLAGDPVTVDRIS